MTLEDGDDIVKSICRKIGKTPQESYGSLRCMLTDEYEIVNLGGFDERGDPQLIVRRRR